MNSSGQKAGFSIAAMIGVIIVAGISVDWWDARQTPPPPKPVEALSPDDPMVKRLVEENERLKTDNALLNMKNDVLRKQIEEMNQPPVEVVKDGKPPGG